MAKNEFDQIISSYLKEMNSIEIKGKKAPIIMGSNLFKIKQISTYKNQNSLKSAPKFENFIISGKLKSINGNQNKIQDSIIKNNKDISKHNKSNTSDRFYLGKILTRETSDFISIIASKLLKKSNINDFKLTQYPIFPKERMRRLIIFTNIEFGNILQNISEIEEKLDVFSKLFRKTMADMVVI